MVRREGRGAGRDRLLLPDPCRWAAMDSGAGAFCVGERKRGEMDMSATIVFVPQFKDLLLEKLPSSKAQALTVLQIREMIFPDHVRSDIDRALDTLRKWQEVDRYHAIRNHRTEAYWWRVAE